jgi:hypothetical protein
MERSYLHLAERGLVFAAPGQGLGTAMPGKRPLYSFDVAEEVYVDQGLQAVSQMRHIAALCGTHLNVFLLRYHPCRLFLPIPQRPVHKPPIQPRVRPPPELGVARRGDILHGCQVLQALANHVLRRFASGIVEVGKLKLELVTGRRIQSTAATHLAFEILYIADHGVNGLQGGFRVDVA